MPQPVDRSILQEIVRIIEARRKVPERVRVRAREYLITYLEDHQRRLQEALQRYDSDRLNMLYGQLASKVKYQLLRRLPARAEPKTAKKKVAGKVPKRPAKGKKAAAKKKPAKRVGAKKASGKRPAAKKRVSRTPAASRKHK